ncbi:MAG: NAD-dependent dihydropyrimidine dehydrogenase subunit PreA [Anaerolineaceae bacterium]|nr:NAD-dependent dihydropyrimidine dehydrogenase subunit PreA [Anaerolineaceae bacterium]
MVDLRIDFCGVSFENPFILAASPSTDNREMTTRGLEHGWAGAVLKTTSLETEEVSITYPIMSGLRPGPGLVGLQNTDLLSERHIHEVAEDIAWLKSRFPEKRIIASLMGSTRAEWHELVKISEQAGADMIEASISCPQGAELEGEPTLGWMVSQDPHQTEKVTRWVVEGSRSVPVYVKLSPSVTDIVSIGKAVERGGGNGICAIDCLEGIGGIDLQSFSPLPSVQGKGTRGGFSGRAVKPIGLRIVADLAGAVQIPISGVGGIYDWRDALEYLLLGATTVQICTAVLQRGFNLIDPLTDGLSRWLEGHRYGSPTEVIGLALPKLTEHDHLEHGVKVTSRIDPELCIGCGLCYVACADGGHMAIEFPSDRSPQVQEGLCVGCGLCAQVCPVPGCIDVV